MKLFLRLILIGVITYFLSMVFPWWIVSVIGFLIGWLIPGSSFSSFASGFLGAGLVWMGYAWYLDAVNESQFSTVMLSMLPVNDIIPLLGMVGLIGGLIGGLSSMTGSLLRSSKPPEQTGTYYH